MKTLILSISMLLVLTVSGYGQNSKVNSMLKKDETRKEIFNKILNNQEYMSEFIKDMHGNQHAMMMIRGNNGLMGTGQTGMYKGNSMMNGGHMGTYNGNQSMGGGHMGTYNGNQSMGSGHMGMYGNNRMYSQNYMMNMMHQNPAMMNNLMGNMVGAAATDSTESRDLINMMSTYPMMSQMMTHWANHHGMMGYGMNYGKTSPGNKK